MNNSIFNVGAHKQSSLRWFSQDAFIVWSEASLTLIVDTKFAYFGHYYLVIICNSLLMHYHEHYSDNPNICFSLTCNSHDFGTTPTGVCPEHKYYMI